jgi:hypothetical protein
MSGGWWYSQGAGWCLVGSWVLVLDPWARAVSYRYELRSRAASRACAVWTAGVGLPGVLRTEQSGQGLSHCAHVSSLKSPAIMASCGINDGGIRWHQRWWHHVASTLVASCVQIGVGMRITLVPSARLLPRCTPSPWALASPPCDRRC